MKKVILLSCDGYLVDVEEVVMVKDEDVEICVKKIFNKSVENSDVEDIMEWELSKEDIDYKFVEREFECGNEWNSIVVVDGNLKVEEKDFN